MEYLDTEKELQLIRIHKLGINTKGQSFEQMINTVLSMLEEKQSINYRFSCEKLGDCIIHSTDFNGKCFNCGKQVFVREENQ